jgi:hypothetical protein
MVRIEGTVSHAVAATELYLQDGVMGVRVATDFEKKLLAERH